MKLTKLLLYVLTKESLTQITNPNLQARKAEHIEVRGRAHSYRVSHWPEPDTHFLTPRQDPGHGPASGPGSSELTQRAHVPMSPQGGARCPFMEWPGPG